MVDTEKLAEGIYEEVKKGGSKAISAVIRGLKKEETDEVERIISYLEDRNAKDSRFIEVTAIFAQNPKEEEISILKNQIRAKTNKEPKVNVSVDKSIIGGIILKYDDIVIDNSLIFRIEQLSKKLKTVNTME